jgi:hypothetical protein
MRQLGVAGDLAGVIFKDGLDVKAPRARYQRVGVNYPKYVARFLKALSEIKYSNS